MNLTNIQQANVSSLAFFGPELVLTVGVVVLFLADLLTRRSARRVPVLMGMALATLAISALSAAQLTPFLGRPLFNGMLVHDTMGLFFKFLFLSATALGIWMAGFSKEIAPERMGEYFAMLLAMCLGMDLMACSGDLLMVYLSLEMVSLLSYVLAGYRRSDRRASEAALKYVIYGGVASGIMLFGLSYLYGMVGSTDLLTLANRLQGFSHSLAAVDGGVRIGSHLTILVAIVFVLAGIGYKVASVPWHMWCPDVYEGAPTPFTAFLSVGPKAAGFALALRFFFVGLAHNTATSLESGASIVSNVPWPAILGVVAAITMTLGNFAALHQNNMKRLLAYSSIAHAGYIMMGLATGTLLGNMSVLIYLSFYVLMNVGAFLVVSAVARAGNESIFEYRGLGSRAPFVAIAMAVFLFSLTGLPFFAGFIGKFYLFYAVVLKATTSFGIDSTGWWLLAIIGALNSAVSLFYYARVIRAMFLEKSARQERTVELPWGYSSAIAGLVGLVVLFGIYWAPISEAAEFAVRTMYHG